MVVFAEIAAQVVPAEDQTTSEKYSVKTPDEGDLTNGIEHSSNEEKSERETADLDSQSFFFGDLFTPPGFISVNSQFQEKWDMLMLLLLSFVMVVTPFEVCFLSSQTVHDGLFWINRLVDICFLIDMICQVFLIPQDIDIGSVHPNETGSSYELRMLLLDRYMKGWFFIDFVSILPYDLISWIIQNSVNTDLNALRMLRIVRLARLVKVLRVLRASPIIARYDDRVGISFVKFRITKYITIVLLMSHWMACALRLVPSIEDNPEKSWILAYFGTDDEPPMRVYNTAWYWYDHFLAACHREAHSDVLRYLASP